MDANIDISILHIKTCTVDSPYPPASYNLLLNVDNFQFEMTMGDETFKWTFIPKKFFVYEPKFNGKQKDWVFEAPENCLELYFVEVLQKFRSHFPGDINTFTINPAVLQNCEDTAKIGFAVTSCKQLRMRYEPNKEPEKESKIDLEAKQKAYKNLETNVSFFLKRIMVTKDTTIRNFPLNDELDPEKICRTQTTEIEFKSANAEKIMAFASRISFFSVDKFGIEDINQLLQMWLNSSGKHIYCLNLSIKNTEKANMDAFFVGLRHRHPTCCTHQPQQYCVMKNVLFLKRMGLTLIRHDKAEATIFYDFNRTEYTFKMLVTYPNEDWYGEASKEFSGIMHNVKTHTEQLLKLGNQIKENAKFLEMMESTPGFLPSLKYFVSVARNTFIDRLGYSHLVWNDHFKFRAKEKFNNLEEPVYCGRKKRLVYGYLDLQPLIELD